MGLSNQLELASKIAWLMLQKIRKAMAQRDSDHTLSGFIEMDDVFLVVPPKAARDGEPKTKLRPYKARDQLQIFRAGRLAR